ncbi:mRNA 3'-end-processing protein yth-1 [Madurella mycetomatis]|uniref:mRNA 3'-end-processing protein n=1 Tax=Madurella mycetomatis TaxID=100816 RepID=A0A175W1C4_9PEZI|nr:mRNA 3'-end-processing protein yth-1 [Madurella mycetomatis]
MATTTEPQQSPPTSHLASQLLAHTAPTYTFTFTPFLQRTYQHSLPADRPICKAYLAGNCPLKSHCPERHTGPSTSSSNTQQTNNARDGGGGGGFGSLVCKHWLRGLCKKGESCEFLHEYNLRKMPECNFFVRNGYCSNGDECLYLHIDPLSRLPPCPHYDRGFCPLGPRCDKKHVRRRLCLYYLAGFCPMGKACREGAHPRWVADGELEKPKVKEERGKEEAAASQEDRERDREREMQQERGGRDRDGGGERGHDGRGHKDRFGGGRGGRWRGKGGGSEGGAIKKALGIIRAYGYAFAR